MSGRRLVTIILAVSVCGCATGLPEKPMRLDSKASTWSRLAAATTHAAQDPWIWGGLATAIVLTTDDLDQQISEQLRDSTPVFGSSRAANDASEDFRSLTSLAYVSSALLVPIDQAENKFLERTYVLGAEWLTVQSTRWLTSGLKSLSERERPNGRDDKSLPSGHASRAAVQSQLAVHNLQQITMQPQLRLGLESGLHASTFLTAWGRVEAGLHYPSDVIAGWVLGRFMGNLAGALLFSEPLPVSIRTSAGPGSWQIDINYTF